MGSERWFGVHPGLEMRASTVEYILSLLGLPNITGFGKIEKHWPEFKRRDRSDLNSASEGDGQIVVGVDYCRCR